MGKGDRRTRKGKIRLGTYGKSRPNPKKVRRLKKAKAMEQSKIKKKSKSAPEKKEVKSTPDEE